MASRSGAPIAALRLAAGLSDAGHEIRALFLYRREDVEAGDFPVRSLMTTRPQGALDFLRMLWRLDEAIREFRPQGIITFLPLASILACTLGWIHGARARIVSHRVPRATYGRLLLALDRLLAWAGVYSDVVAVSRSVARSCRSYPRWLRRRVRVIYNGLKDWQPSSLGRDEARRRFDVPRDAFVVAAVGRIDPQKNYRVLIDAMPGLPVKVVLAIAGDGSEREEVEARIASEGLGDRVRLLGNIPRGEVPDLLKAADLFAQPSLFEGQSNALLEALAAGLPCFVSEAPEQAETISGPAGTAGAILPTHDPESWEAAIASACCDPNYRTKVGPAVAAQAARFTFSRMIGDFQNMLSDRLA
ncbi:glycosyltransferase family 4 protein [Sphingomonas sp. LY54]|uniref:glycosyltransferase family 4 protein n=1 Tax=Sphingomonas sp. LY54 TaxID=3095343 RepID=UPI002D770698|nr:glycosyltransferase family 4 protein [Sphingomonas sp. LY54]WRP28215.1 glycosyltransferase family 4 protein [Sphingomonas sp. LY54]